MLADGTGSGEIFDDWPDRYNQWFETPIGRLVKKYEAELLQQMLRPQKHELLLDVGCGTGVFTGDVLAAGASVVGLDISRPMLSAAFRDFGDQLFIPVLGSMERLPFASGSFDKVYSMTALEFVENARLAIAELNRVTKTGGTIVLSTLNSLSPWARRRRQKARQGHRIFENMILRSPDQMRRLVPDGAVIKTAIHFSKDEDPLAAPRIEAEGRSENLDTGAFLAVCWTNALPEINERQATNIK